MILFWSTLAIAFALAVSLWRLGHRRVALQGFDRYHIYDLVSAVLWSAMFFAWAQQYWIELKDVAVALRGVTPQDLPLLADKMDEARVSLTMWGGGLVLSMVSSAFALIATCKAFMRRPAEKAAQPQEIHA